MQHFPRLFPMAIYMYDSIFHRLIILFLLLLMVQNPALAGSSVANTMVNQVVGLAAEFPELEGIEISKGPDGLPSIRFSYGLAKGSVSAEPLKKGTGNPQLMPGGFSFSLVFYQGEWQGAAFFEPIRLENANLWYQKRLGIPASDNALLMFKRIDGIISDAKKERLKVDGSEAKAATQFYPLPSTSERAMLLGLTPVSGWRDARCTKIDRSQYRNRYKGNLPQAQRIIAEFDVNSDGLCETYERLSRMGGSGLCLSRLITQKINTTASVHRWSYRLENIGDINGLSITHLYEGEHGYAFIETRLAKSGNEVAYILYKFNGKEYRPIREDTYEPFEARRRYRLKKTRRW